MIKTIDVRDKFAVRRAGSIVQTGSLHDCRAAARALNNHESSNGRTPDYWVSLHVDYEGFRELIRQAGELGLNYEFLRLFTSEYKGDQDESKDQKTDRPHPHVGRHRM